MEMLTASTALRGRLWVASRRMGAISLPQRRLTVYTPTSSLLALIHQAIGRTMLA